MAWYFAYGSNMQLATFRGRRGIAYRRALPARVAGWRLVLDKPPLFSIGQSFANVIEDAGAEVLGVLYEVDDAALELIDLTEGVLIGNYERVIVAAAPFDAAVEPVPAYTLTSARRDPSLQPSIRYMALLIEGALEHGLPAAYVEHLRGIAAVEDGPLAKALRPLLDSALAGFRAARPSEPE